MDTLTGIILGAIFGSLFLLTCVISAVKAVRDRKRIKTRIAQREREKRANGTIPGTGIEEHETQIPTGVVIDHTTERNHESNGHIATEIQFSIAKSKSEDANSSYSSSSGLDNLTHSGIDNLNFERSFVDIPLADESQEEENSDNNHKESKVNPAFQSKCDHSNPVILKGEKPTKFHTANEKREKEKTCTVNENGRDKMKKSASSDDKDSKRQLEMKHLSPECLAVKKLLRRHSYEVAISDYTWLPNGEPPPSYASIVIENGNAHDGKRTQKKYSLGCENKAYDKDDHKRSSAL